MQKYFKAFLIILIPLIIYLAVFGFYAYNDRFYTKLTDAHSNMPEKAEKINLRMVIYFLCDCENPQGLEEFSPKEIIHLKDVKKVINTLITLLMILSVAFIILISVAQDKAGILYIGGIITLLTPLLLMIIPFDVLFTQMHNIFFAKGTWVFAPNALLIRLYPAEFFQAFAEQIFLTGFCLGLVITLLARTSMQK